MFLLVSYTSNCPKKKNPLNNGLEWFGKIQHLEYAGVFFRAGGGEAEAFGKVQQDNSPKIISARFTWDVLHHVAHDH